jgi:hypothetical protein
VQRVVEWVLEGTLPVGSRGQTEDALLDEAAQA